MQEPKLYIVRTARATCPPCRGCGYKVRTGYPAVKRPYLNAHGDIRFRVYHYDEECLNGRGTDPVEPFTGDPRK